MVIIFKYIFDNFIYQPQGEPREFACSIHMIEHHSGKDLQGRSKSKFNLKSYLIDSQYCNLKICRNIAITPLSLFKTPQISSSPGIPLYQLVVGRMTIDVNGLPNKCIHFSENFVGWVSKYTNNEHFCEERRSTTLSVTL